MGRVRRLPILMYHSVDDSGSVVSTGCQLFRSQVRWLAGHGWRCVSLSEACNSRNLSGEWPINTAVMTFDDAYENVSTLVLPELHKHEFTATLFVVTGHVGAYNDWAPIPEPLGRQRIMNWDQLEHAHRAGMELAAHTKSHPNLTQLSARQVCDELDSSQAMITKKIGSASQSFAYPYGLYNAAIEAAACERFANVCTTSLARVGAEPNSALPRVDMYYVRSLAAFERLMAGRLDTYLTIRRWGRQVKRALAV